mmetsp:Transcript_18727/g.41690  ORF Transcript_18727/g.41690 Transcript_18727/m.41690 type:complete len:239 (-) Transcript_18727:902-1618(-)
MCIMYGTTALLPLLLYCGTRAALEQRLGQAQDRFSQPMLVRLLQQLVHTVRHVSGGIGYENVHQHRVVEGFSRAGFDQFLVHLLCLLVVPLQLKGLPQVSQKGSVLLQCQAYPVQLDGCLVVPTFELPIPRHQVVVKAPRSLLGTLPAHRHGGYRGGQGTCGVIPALRYVHQLTRLLDDLHRVLRGRECGVHRLVPLRHVLVTAEARCWDLTGRVEHPVLAPHQQLTDALSVYVEVRA